MSETILLVEDDDSLSHLAQRLLMKFGYTVLAADGGSAALATCQEHPGEIDLLMTDVFMPEIGGPELAARLLAMRAAMKVLYVSGSNDALEEGGPLAGTANFLEKPYTQDQLNRKIRE